MSVVQPQTPFVTAGGYGQLAREIRELGLMRRRPVFYAGVLALLLLALAASVTGLLLLDHSWWALPLAPVLGVVSAQLGFFGHDAAHRQISHRERPSRWLTLFAANLLNGLSYGWWLEKHNAHHAHPNDLEADPDVQPGAVVHDAGHAATRRGVAGWVTGHQAWLYGPMLTLESVSLHVSSVRAVLHPGLKYRPTEAALLTVHFTAYLTFMFAVLTWQQAIVTIAVHQVVFGVYLGMSFAPGHKGMPVLTREQAADPLLRQVLTSRNVRGGRFLSAVMGGLNFQIEHHLFPSMPRPNLPRAQQVVRRFCADRAVSYAEVSVAATYSAVIRHLDQVGAGQRASR
ncbi:MAG: fatty acid desaturase family protein [Marmoricola sp.]